jgi:hypothetical protein
MTDILPTSADIAVSPPSQERLERRMAAIKEAKALRAETCKRRGGSPLPSSWQLIRRARDAYARRV